MHLGSFNPHQAHAPKHRHSETSVPIPKKAGEKDFKLAAGGDKAQHPAKLEGSYWEEISLLFLEMFTKDRIGGQGKGGGEGNEAEVGKHHTASTECRVARIKGRPIPCVCAIHFILYLQQLKYVAYTCVFGQPCAQMKHK
eukprot:scaffold41329_cov21-Tisochrysis_lutea.AAC.1